MKYIVYQTVNKVNNKIYIGVHQTENPEIFDGYLGNGCWTTKPSSYMHPKTHFQGAVKKYGPKSFIRTVLQVFDTEAEAYALEVLLVTSEFVKREDVYNLIPGGNSGERWSIPVYMYNLDGEFEKEFESLLAAAKYFNSNTTSGGHLPRAIKNRHLFLGHQFSYEKVENIGPIKAMRNRTIVEKPYSGKKVGKFDLEGNLLETFETMTDCVKAGYKNAKLVALGKRNTCKGFIFKYLD